MVLFSEICYDYFAMAVFKLLLKKKGGGFVAFKNTSFVSIASGLCAFCGTQWNTNSTRLFFLWPQLQSSMIPPCPSYARWDSRWRPAEKPCTTLATLESIPPWIGLWPIWKTRVCRTAQSWLKKKENTLPVRSAQPSRSSSLWLAADFAAPLVLPGCSSGPGTTPTESLSEDHLATIVSMGFSRDQATKALRAKVRIQFSWFFSVSQHNKDATHTELTVFSSSF